MDEPVKLSDDELHNLRTLHERFKHLVQVSGEFFYEKHCLESKIKLLEHEFDALEQQRYTMTEALQTKYGLGSVNLDTGEFLKS